jgi:hypothetical protein
LHCNPYAKDGSRSGSMRTPTNPLPNQELQAPANTANTIGSPSARVARGKLPVAMNREHWSLYSKLWSQFPVYWQQVAARCGVHEKTIDLQLRGANPSAADTVKAIR